MDKDQKDNIETLSSWAAQKLNEHDVALYSLDTDGDFYYFVVIPYSDRQDFERVSQEWGVGYKLIQPLQTPFQAACKKIVAYLQGIHK